MKIKKGFINLFNSSGILKDSSNHLDEIGRNIIPLSLKEKMLRPSGPRTFKAPT